MMGAAVSAGAFYLNNKETIDNAASCTMNVINFMLSIGSHSIVSWATTQETIRNLEDFNFTLSNSNEISSEIVNAMVN